MRLPMVFTIDIEKRIGLVALGAALLFLSSGTIPVQAHNGSIAVAVPVAGITVDGDLSDWPEGLVRYPIRLAEFGGVPASVDDFEADFRVGYSREENALYVAVEVQDESIVVVEDGGTWDDQDGCDVFVKASHTQGETERWAWQHAVWGDQPQTVGPRDAVDRAAGAELGIGRSSTGHRYEWRLQVFDYEAEPVELRAGSVLSFDVSVGDKDRDGSYSWIAWGRGSTKVTFDQRRGDLLLVEKAADLGRLEGRILWQEPGIRPGRTRIQFTKDTDFYLMAEADAEGRFTADVPAGSYRARIVGQDDSEEDIEIEVDPGSVREVELLMSPQGGRVGSGKGPSAPVGSALGRGAWQTFGLPDGLLSPMVTDIIQDNRGHLWLATGQGVTRYDGETFTAFTSEDGLVGDRVRAIFEDSRGHLWFGTDRGVSRYDGEFSVSFSVRDGLPANDVYSILEDRQGHLWFGTAQGASRYDGESFVTLDIPVDYVVVDGEHVAVHGVLSMVEDSRGHLWFGTGLWAGVGGHGVSRYDGEDLVTFTREDGLAGDQVLSMMEDSRGDIWFGTNRGVSRYDGESFTTVAAAADLGYPMVQDVLEDDQGHFWFATGSIGGVEGRGVSRFDGERFVSFTTAEGLGSNEALSLFEDRQGYLWIGTMRTGVSRYDGGRLALFTQADGLVDDDVRVIEEDSRGHLWFGTGRGVSRYDGKGFTHFTAADGLVDDDVRVIEEDSRGNLWFGAGRGVSRYDGSAFTHFTAADGLVDDDVRVIEEDSRGNLWFGAGRGVSRYDGEGLEPFPFGGQGQPGTSVVGLVADDEGDIWVATDHGVSRYDLKSGDGVSLTAADGLGGNMVRDLLQDRRGNIWIATENGISRYDGHQFVNFTPDDGLVYKDAVKLLEDRQGHLWIATTGGISRYDGQVFHTLYLGDWLAHHEVRDLLQDRRGDIWIATENGVARYRPYYGPLAIRLNIVADREYGSVSQLTLPASQRFLAFEFSGQRLVRQGKAMLYRYRLEGYDAGWRQTHAGRAEYHDVAPGDYTFAVEAIDNDLNYSERLQVSLKVLPPWHKTPATVALLAVIVLGAAGGSLVAGRRYIGQRREAARMRQQQLALYRVRERVWQMMDSADIDSVVASAAENSRDLGVRFQYFGVNVIDPRAVDRVTCYTLDQAGEWLYHEAEGAPLIIDFWRQQEVVYRPDLHRDDPYGERQGRDPQRSVIDVPSSHGVAAVGHRETEASSQEDIGIRQKLAGMMADGTLRSVIDVPFSHGTLAASSTEAEAFSEEDIGILQELAGVLSEGFRRMDDLRTLEQRRQELEDEITERTQAEEEAKEAKEEAVEASRAKSVFLANMSHEIRTPMNAILGYAQILQGDANLTDDQRRGVETIERSGDHLLALINDILDITKIEAGHQELNPIDFDLLSFIEDLSTMFELRCRQKGLDWQVRTDLPRPRVHGDENKLRQVLINLLGNAAKFTTQGRVELAVEERGEGRFCFSVADTGPGIAADSQQAIFEPFQQAVAGVDKGGTGLGLTIALRHLELMGGRLELESTEGEGSLFSFELVLPSARGDVAAGAEERWSQVAGLASGQQVRALVVDDVAENREVLSIMLEQVGAGVDLAVDGEEGVSKVRKGEPDIVFMDIRMPGMDGSEARRRIIEEHGAKAPKVVAVTASALIHQRQQYLEEGFDGYIDKPFRSGEVYAVLARLLGVEFEQVAAPGEEMEAETPEGELNLTGVSLPADLYEGLTQAARQHNVTDLLRRLDALAGMGEAEQRLAAHLRGLSQAYDMRAIRSVLEKISGVGGLSHE